MTTLVANRFERVHCAMMNLLWPRAGLEVEDFYYYWVGAHTQISSRLPGIHQYFQHHLDPVGGRLLPSIDGTVQDFAEDELFYGDAEITFATAANLQAFADALHPLMEDEQNVFRKTISYQALEENSVTYLDDTRNDSPNGDFQPEQKFMLYLRRRPDVDLADFRDELLNDTCPSLATAAHVIKVRARLLEFYDNDKVTLLAPNVSNREESAKQYQACIELVFPDELGRQAFGQGSGWETASIAIGQLAHTVHVQRVLRTYTVYNHGVITTAGLRTPFIADQISRLGAINQVGDEVRQLLLKEHTASGL